MEPDGTLAELYNLERDPSESDNLIRAQPETAARLEAKLRAWFRDLPKPLERPIPASP